MSDPSTQHPPFEDNLRTDNGGNRRLQLDVDGGQPQLLLHLEEMHEEVLPTTRNRRLVSTKPALPFTSEITMNVLDAEEALGRLIHDLSRDEISLVVSIFGNASTTANYIDQDDDRSIREAFHSTPIDCNLDIEKGPMESKEFLPFPKPSFPTQWSERFGTEQVDTLHVSAPMKSGPADENCEQNLVKINSVSPTFLDIESTKPLSTTALVPAMRIPPDQEDMSCGLDTFTDRVIETRKTVVPIAPLGPLPELARCSAPCKKSDVEDSSLKRKPKTVKDGNEATKKRTKKVFTTAAKAAPKVSKNSTEDCNLASPPPPAAANTVERKSKSMNGGKKGKHEKISAYISQPSCTNEKQWIKNFEEAKEFIRIHGHGRIPISHPRLGKWAARQRYHFKVRKQYFGDETDDLESNEAQNRPTKNRRKGQGVHVVKCLMTAKRLAKLREIGFCLDNQQGGWDCNYELLCKFAARNGGCTSPSKHTHYELWKWVGTQRYEMSILNRCEGSDCYPSTENKKRNFHQSQRKTYLTAERIRKLNAIQFIWHSRKPSPKRVDTEK